MGEDWINALLGKMAHILDSDTEKEQGNSCGKTIDKLIDNLFQYAREERITTDMLFAKIDGSRIDKKFSFWDGKLKQMKIILGDTSEQDD